MARNIKCTLRFISHRDRAEQFCQYIAYIVSQCSGSWIHIITLCALARTKHAMLHLIGIAHSSAKITITYRAPIGYNVLINDVYVPCAMLAELVARICIIYRTDRADAFESKEKKKKRKKKNRNKWRRIIRAVGRVLDAIARTLGGGGGFGYVYESFLLLITFVFLIDSVTRIEENRRRSSLACDRLCELRIAVVLFIRQREQKIDWLLTEAAKNMKSDEAKSFIEFVARSGYKVKPKVSKNGKQSSRRTTPLHHLCRRDSWPFSANLPVVANWLFDIYDGIDVNYTDKSKLTHFHVACKFGRTGVVKKFLELGQDPNLIWPEEKRSPLHLAMERRQREVAELLLRAGADPNSVDNDGMTPLITICEYHGDVDLARMLFELSDKKYRVPVDHLDEYKNTPLHLALNYDYTELALFLLIMGADPNLADGADGNNGLHHVCKMGEGNDGLADMIFGNDGYKPLPINAQNDKGNTPLHLAVKSGASNMVEVLLRHGADSNATNKKGMTPLHLLCKKYDDPTMLNLFLRVNDELGRPVLIDALDNKGATPLVWALGRDNIHSAEVLLRRGANPSLGTPLNRICYYYDEHWVELFFELIDARNQVVDINARDSEGDTPLHVAVYCGNRNSTELLLRRGGDPNLVNNKGMTALHLICKRSDDDDLAERFFAVNDEIGQRVLVDARDNLGNTPLHLALSRGHRNLVGLLLRRGASTGATSPLHVICKRYQDDGLAKMYIDINKELDRLVLVDARDELGRTPLQLALTSLLPDAIDALLANGAALPSAFPTVDDFRQRFNPEYNENYVKLRIASGILVVIECLCKHGYEMDRTDALKIMKLFADFGLSEKSTSLEKYWFDDETFADKSKETMVMPSLSLYDLIQLSSKEAAKRVAPADYFKFACSMKWYRFTEEHGEVCVLHLCEKLSRRFFLGWALECFMELIHYRLPVLCCDMIIQNLNNQDLSLIAIANARTTNKTGLCTDARAQRKCATRARAIAPYNAVAAAAGLSDREARMSLHTTESPRAKIRREQAFRSVLAARRRKMVRQRTGGAAAAAAAASAATGMMQQEASNSSHSKYSSSAAVRMSQRRRQTKKPTTLAAAARDDLLEMQETQNGVYLTVPEQQHLINDTSSPEIVIRTLATK
ncbi:unnamed protein product [Trichogramma brassicae]|uniref:Uncharacterized protein n=1 Tax=Trichogramma brassicae TaxID=86971 RepID=A0A6H5IAC1_9HYME|nr:unnamed protein product [Trichogramma brassicae]